MGDNLVFRPNGLQRQRIKALMAVRVERDPRDINDIGYCMCTYDDAKCHDCFSLEDCPGAMNVRSRRRRRLYPFTTWIIDLNEKYEKRAVKRLSNYSYSI